MKNKKYVAIEHEKYSKVEMYMLENKIDFESYIETIKKDKLERINKVLRINFENIPIMIYRQLIDIIKEGE